MAQTTPLAAAVLVAGFGCTEPAGAQTSASHFAQHAITIPGSALTPALNRLAAQSGLQIVFDARLATGKTTAGVTRAASVRAALAGLLAGTGLSARFTGPNTATIEAVANAPATATLPAGTVTLDEIDVQGARETGLGPVRGLVAHQSVTATKTDTPLLKTPQSVSVVSRDQIRLQQPTTIGETLRYTPGVVAEEYGGTDTRIDQYVIRGFQSSMPFLDGLSTIGRYTLLSTAIDPYGAERVEVLRGPASVLYGQNVPGGIVDVVSKRPLPEPFHEIELQGGTFGRAQGAFDLSGPVVGSDSLLYRIVGLGRESGTQIDRVDTSRYYLAPSATWQPDAATTVTLLAHAQHSSDGFAFQNLPAEGTLRPSSVFGRIPTSFFTGEPDFNNVTRDDYAIGYSAEHRFNANVAVRQNLRYSYLDTSIKYVGVAGLEPGTSLLDRFSLGAKAHQENFAVDTQGQFNFDTWALQHTAIVGVDYLRSADRWVERDGTAASLDLLNPVYGQGFTQPDPDFATRDTLNQVGLYAQDQVDWNRFTLTTGVRQDWADTTVTDLISNSAAPQHDAATTGRVGLTYQLGNGVAPYISYATSFQPQIGSTFAGTPYEPTTGEQIEGGVKVQPAGWNSLVTLAGYSLDETNVPTQDPLHPFFNVQTGAVEVNGFEASGVADLDDGWRAIAAYTFMDATITQDNGGNVGKRPLDVPRNLASLLVDKTFVGGTLGGFGLGGGVRFVGQRFGDNANTLSIPSNLLFDADVHYERDGWRAAVNVKNLLDKTYVGTCASESFCYYGQRRTVLGTLTYRW